VIAKTANEPGTGFKEKAFGHGALTAIISTITRRKHASMSEFALLPLRDGNAWGPIVRRQAGTNIASTAAEGIKPAHSLKERQEAGRP
jgi:hypothetical protein